MKQQKTSNEKNAHFSYEERVKIETFLDERYGVCAIARKLCRAKGSMSDEIRRNKVNGVYLAKKTQEKTYQRYWRARHQHLKVVMSDVLRHYVQAKTPSEAGTCSVHPNTSQPLREV